MFPWLKLLKHLFGVNLSLQEGMALLECVQTSTLSDQDRALVSKIIRATVSVPDDPLQEPSPSHASFHTRPIPQHKATRHRQSAHASRRHT